MLPQALPSFKYVIVTYFFLLLVPLNLCQVSPLVVRNSVISNLTDLPASV